MSRRTRCPYCRDKMGRGVRRCSTCGATSNPYPSDPAERPEQTSLPLGDAPRERTSIDPEGGD